MNSKSRSLIAGLIICTMLLGNLVAVVMAQPPEDKGKSESTPADENKPIKSEKLKSDDVAKEFNAKRNTDNKIKAADEFLKGKGFSAKTNAEDAMGQKDTFKGKDEQGNDQESTSTLKAQNYEKKGSKDAAAVAEVEVVSGGEKRTYSYILIAPDGDVNKAEEYAIVEENGKGKVEKAHSWWSCTRAKASNCGSTCVAALTSCWGGNWVAYLGCLVVRCGGCYVKAAACCGCDCSWWCRWAVGCCDA